MTVKEKVTKILYGTPFRITKSIRENDANDANDITANSSTSLLKTIEKMHIQLSIGCFFNKDITLQRNKKQKSIEF